MNDWEHFPAWFKDHHPDRDTQLEALRTFGAELLAQPTALISAGDKSRLWTRHVQECLSPEFINAFSPELRVLDVGSGNGLPGIVLAIMRPDLQVTLLEPRYRKSGFLERLILLLGLGRVTVAVKSLEALEHEVGGQWDAAVSRALKWTPDLISVLEAITSPGAILYRFGPDRGMARDIQLEGRAIQVLPKESWRKEA